MKEFVGLKAKRYTYITDENNESKKEEGTKRCVMKGKLKSEDYKIFLAATQLENKIIHLNTNKNDIKSQKITKNLEFIKKE